MRITFCNKYDIIVNLIVFALIWAVSIFNYYLIHYHMKYIPGNIFVNNAVASIAEIVSDMFPALFLDRLGIKLSMLLSLILSIFGGICVYSNSYYTFFYCIFILVAKVGTNWLLGNCYLCTSIVFPAHLRSRAYGICNLIGRTALIICPIVAESDNAMLIFVIVSASALLPAVLIRAKNNYY